VLAFKMMSRINASHPPDHDQLRISTPKRRRIHSLNSAISLEKATTGGGLISSDQGDMLTVTRISHPSDDHHDAIYYTASIFNL
jgi:hypothetical protein